MDSIRSLTTPSIREIQALNKDQDMSAVWLAGSAYAL